MHKIYLKFFLILFPKFCILGQIENHSCQENPLFKTEQGKYLADSKYFNERPRYEL